MARKRKKRSTPKLPPRMAFLVLVLVVVVLGGIAGVKFFQSPRGLAMLLDRGFSGHFHQVQLNIDHELREALSRFDLREHTAEIVFRTASGKGTQPYELRVYCPPKVDLIRVNVALTEAAHRGGGGVQSSRELDGGQSLLMVIGSGRHETHRVTLTTNAPVRNPRSTGSRKTDHPIDRTDATGKATSDVPRVAIVIDDFGYAGAGVSAKLIEMDLPLTIAILPGLRRSEQIMKRAAADHCTLLHLPMEAESGETPDVTAITTDMSDDEISRLVEQYLDGMPRVDGVNNHQGSLATADPRVMRAVLRVVKERKLFFLDSLTSSKSVAYNTAKEMGVPTARNTLFLDADTDDPEEVEARIRQLVAQAQKYGSAIGIGHPHRWTLEALERTAGFLKTADVQVVPVCDLVR